MNCQNSIPQKNKIKVEGFHYSKKKRLNANGWPGDFFSGQQTLLEPLNIRT